MRDGDGCGTLLYDASFHRQAGVTHLLLEHNADVNARGDADRTSLHFACRFGHTEVVQLLLEYGADVNARQVLRRPLDDTTHDEHHKYQHNFAQSYFTWKKFENTEGNDSFAQDYN
jgi:ankyrin repeat protein